MNKRIADPEHDDARIETAPWFRLIAETTEDFISVVDGSGRRLYVNPALARALGARPGLDAFSDIHAEDRERVQRLFSRVVADGVGRRSEFRVVLPGGEVRHVESQGNPIRDPEGRVLQVVVVSRDITERRRTEDALRTREAQLQAAQELASLGSWEFNVQTGEIWWSKELRAIYGVDEGFQPTLESSRAMVHPEDLEDFVQATENAMRSGAVYDKPYRIVRPDGRVRTLFASGRIEHDPAGRLARLVGVCQDITDRTWIEKRARSAAERLRSLSRRLVEVQEAERRLLARELHDRVGQTLTALGLNLKVAARQLSPDSAQTAGARLDECMALVEETLAAMRNVMGELRPQALDDYGLPAALRNYAKAFSKRTGIDVTVVARERPGELPKAVELAMFRIAQEALNNAAKHSRATAVEVSCSARGEGAVLSLLDDGTGFDPDLAPAQSARDRQGWGLLIMRERAEAVGATVRVDAAPGRGTRIVVEYPG